MPVPNIFGTATSAIPLSQLDTNFATPVTIGNTAVQLGNTVTSFGNVTLTNVTISSGNVTVTGANVSGTANVSTLVVTGNQTSLGNVAITGNISANIATFGAGSNTAPSITTTGDTNTGIFFPAADTIAFSEGGVESMRIDSAGNVGIGTIPSPWRATQSVLQIGRNAGLSQFDSSGTGISTILASNSYIDSTNTFRYIQSSGAVSYTQRPDITAHIWNIAPVGTAGDAISFTQAMTLDASGNLGIGQTSPAYTLDVNGTMRLGSAGSIQPLLSRSSAEGGLLVNTTAGGGAAFIVQNNGTEQARIDSSGNLLVGATSTVNSARETVSFQSSSGGTGISFIDAQANNTASFAAFYSNVTKIGSITNNGNSAVLYNVTSDQRLKKNIVDAPEFGGIIDSIKVRSYDWIANETHQRAGFIAQELVTIAPEAVHQPTDADEMMAVDYSKLVPMLVKEIQSLRVRVAQLESN